MPILPKNDPRQRLRLQRFFMAAASYALWSAVAAVAYVAGVLMIPHEMILPVLGGLVATNVYFYAFIRSGLNKRVRDPSLTFSQIIVAMCWILVLMFTSAEHRGLMLTVYSMTLLFGIFRLDAADFLALASFAMLGYLGIVAVDYWYFSWRFDMLTEGLRVVVLAGMLIWVSLFGAHVNGLKRALRDRNRELKEAVRQVGKAASRDYLTKAYNRRYIMDALAREKSRADRTRSPFCVLIVDLDHFKTINDRYGHLAGDRVLVAFAERTVGALRGMDIADRSGITGTFGRYGGEEFIVILPATDLAGARHCAERLRDVTASQPFGEGFDVTLSAGVAEYRPGESVEDVLRRADHALYDAKRAGRDRVVADESDHSGIWQIDPGESPGVEFAGRAAPV